MSKVIRLRNELEAENRMLREQVTELNEVADSMLGEIASLEITISKMEQKQGLWNCEDCGFAMLESHMEDADVYYCPMCRLEVAEDALKEAHEVIRTCVALLEEILWDEDLDCFALIDHAETTLPEICDKLSRILPVEGSDQDE